VSIVSCLCVFGISHFGLYYLYSSTNEKDTVGFHIRNLRKKLCDTNSHFSIDSVREIGYRFNSQ
ncbi:helix-turn-helix domain-containing protein, partial [Ruminococcus sp. 1001136sp1_2201st1_G3_2201SCRN_220225]|uniref:helix-turn-helix domain-containing protein n=1 Tax=Ruminococcus sp. 1001136sp1_2201st1_G3_2201SCRN_220225 TaxID=3141596 RepID=UPI0034A3C21A